VIEIQRKDPTYVTFHWTNESKWESGAWRFSLPDKKAAFLEEFKASVPYDYRRWDGANGYWEVESEYGQDVSELVEQYFDASVIWEEGE